MTPLSSLIAKVGIRVKPLEWRTERNGDCHADCELGQYACGVIGIGYTVILRRVRDGHTDDVTLARHRASLNAAKAVAQKHRARTILAALESHPNG